MTCRSKTPCLVEFLTHRFTHNNVDEHEINWGVLLWQVTCRMLALVGCFIEILERGESWYIASVQHRQKLYARFAQGVFSPANCK